MRQGFNLANGTVLQDEQVNNKVDAILEHIAIIDGLLRPILLFLSESHDKLPFVIIVRSHESFAGICTLCQWNQILCHFFYVTSVHIPLFVLIQPSIFISNFKEHIELIQSFFR